MQEIILPGWGKSACVIVLITLGSQDSHLQLNHAVEIIGKVQNDLSVRVMASTDFGPEGNIGESLTLCPFARKCVGGVCADQTTRFQCSGGRRGRHTPLP